MQEIDNARVTDVAWDDPHHAGFLLSPTRSFGPV